MDQVKQYATIIGAQIERTWIFILNSIADKIGLASDQVQWGIVALVLYFLLIFLGTKIHKMFCKRAKNRLAQYTLVYDTILFDIQKKNLEMGATQDLSWIKTIVVSGSYITNMQFLLDHTQGMISEETTKTLAIQFSKYKKTNRIQKFFGFLLTIATVGVYKIVG